MSYFGGQDNFIFKIVLLDRFDCIFISRRAAEADRRKRVEEEKRRRAAEQQKREEEQRRQLRQAVERIAIQETRITCATLRGNF